MISWSKKRFSEVAQLYLLLLCFHDGRPPMILHHPFRCNGNACRMTTLVCARNIPSITGIARRHLELLSSVPGSASFVL